MKTTSKPRVEFLFDFGSPNAYLSHKVLPAIEARQSVRIEYVPILLGGLFKLTGNRSPRESLAGILNKPAYETLEMHRFIAKHGLTEFRRNPFFPVNTLLIMRGAVAANKQGVSARYVETVFRAMWELGLKMDDPAVVASSLDGAGLDAGRILADAGDPSAKGELVRNTQAAFDRGAFGSPTFYVDDEMYFGKDRLVELEQAIAGAISVRDMTAK